MMEDLNEEHELTPLEVETQTQTSTCKEETSRQRFARTIHWYKRSGQTFKKAWETSKMKVCWAIFKMMIKLVIVWAFSVVLCTMDTVTDFALADKYYRYVVVF